MSTNYENHNDLDDDTVYSVNSDLQSTVDDLTGRLECNHSMASDITFA